MDGTPFFQDAFAPYLSQGWIPGRILIEHRQHYLVITPEGEGQASIAGKMRYLAQSRADYPAVGDWVVLRKVGTGQHFKIQHLLPRQSKISRKTAGENPHEQIMGTNVDSLLIMTSLNQDFNLRRLERYLVLARNSGAQPVLLLNKADLCPDTAAKKQMLNSVAPDMPSHLLSALKQQGLEQLEPYLKPGETIALIGSSGVGKSTLLNALAGDPLQSVQGIREDDAKGRHTTSHRQLFRLPGNQGLVLDSPGLREIQLWEGEEGLEVAFTDIQTLVNRCRFRNCRHDREPDCAIQDALRTGVLDIKRFRSFLQLYNETLYLQERKKRMKEMEANIKAKKPVQADPPGDVKCLSVRALSVLVFLLQLNLQPLGLKTPISE